MQQHLVLAGCSWACGEWRAGSDRDIHLEHPGMSQYLQPEYRVTNLARPGYSNWQTLYAVWNYLRHAVSPPDVIIVFQTDSMRDAAHERFDVDYQSLYARSQDLQDFYCRATEIFYYKLQALSQEFQKPVMLCGALTDVDVATAAPHASIQVLCDSWIRLFSPEHEASVVPMTLESTLLQRARAAQNHGLVSDILARADQLWAQAQDLMDTEWMGPSFGDFHPSRKAHEIMSQYIKDYLEEHQ
jgi:hypothetical protein